MKMTWWWFLLRWFHVFWCFIKTALANDITENKTLPEADSPSFLESFLNQDECWIHYFVPETKRQTVQWEKNPVQLLQRKLKVVLYAGKLMPSEFWEVVYYGVYYANFLRLLRKSIKTPRSGKLKKGFLFLQENAPEHKSLASTVALWTTSIFSWFSPYLLRMMEKTYSLERLS